MAGGEGEGGVCHIVTPVTPVTVSHGNVVTLSHGHICHRPPNISILNYCFQLFSSCIAYQSHCICLTISCQVFASGTKQILPISIYFQSLPIAFPLIDFSNRSDRFFQSKNIQKVLLNLLTTSLFLGHNLPMLFKNLNESDARRRLQVCKSERDEHSFVSLFLSFVFLLTLLA